MPPKLQALLARIGGTLKSFTVGQRTIAILAVAVLAMGGFALSSWASKPAYTPLFSGLAGSDASSIVDQLKSDNVPYQLTDGGSTILVPEKNVYDERLKAASAGLPSAAASGYNLLDKMGVTSSEFQQSTTYKRALEGELSKTISAMEGVKTASVKLAIPAESVFVAEKKAPTASVFVETKSGTALSDDKVEAIVHLTSASIQDMTAANVTVVDSKGNVLSSAGTGTAGGTDKRASGYETKTGAAVQAMLDRVVGPGNATVSVAAEMSSDSGQTVQETFVAPDKAPALSESTDTEKYTNGGKSTAGVLGPDNIAVPGGTGNQNGSYDSSKVTKNNAVNKTTQTIVTQPGALKRQSVSVALSAAAANTLDRNALTAMVSNAAGVNTTRGDTVSVQVLPFSTAAADEAAAQLKAAKDDEDAAAAAELWKTILIGAGVLVLLVVALIIFAVRNRRQSRQLVDLGERIEDTVGIEPLPEPVPATTTITAIEPVQEAAPDDAMRRSAEVSALADQNPEKTMQLMRGMMDEKVKA
jgi:flagellar M-ring protein FliF